MKNTVLPFCNETIQPGEKLSLALPLPELFSCAPLYMPIKVIHGKQAGPCLLVTAAMHGNELNGTEIINRLFASKLLKRLKGTLIAVPVVNVYGLINRSAQMPGGLDLESSFPGSKTGTHAARVADLVMQELVAKAEVCVDLQTGFLNCCNLPQVYVDEHDVKAQQLAHAFKAPVISAQSFTGSSYAEAVRRQDKIFLRYEAGEAMRFDEHAIKVGLHGVTDLMRTLGMLPEKKVKKVAGPRSKSFVAQKNIWVRASSSGVYHSDIKLGQHVQQGQRLCVIKDPFGASENVSVTCPEEAVVVGMNNLPLVREGEGIFQLAVFRKMQHAASHLEDWEERSEGHFDQQNGEV